MTSPDSNDSLDRLLAGWRVVPPRQAQFRSSVRARLEGGGRNGTWAGYARAHIPMVAGAVALALAVGAVTGREQARARVEAESRELATSYVQSLDARTMQMP